MHWSVVSSADKKEKKHKEESPPSKSPPSDRVGGHRSYCTSATTHVTEMSQTFDFQSGEELIVLQIREENTIGTAGVTVAGEIILRRLPLDEEDQQTGYITFDMWRSDPGIKSRVEMDASRQAMKITTHSYADLPAGRNHCLSLEVTVWVPPKASFKHIQIEATELSLRVYDDVDMIVSEVSKFGAYAGNILFPSSDRLGLTHSQPEVDEIMPLIAPADSEDRKAEATSADKRVNGEGESLHANILPPTDLPVLGDQNWLKNVSGFLSREIIVGSTYGSISGNFDLYDLLYVDSDSGKIDISVSPRPALATDPQPARLTLTTVSGNIRARFPIRQSASIPDRDYRTSVKSHSGSIHGDYLIGTEAIFSGVSGSMAINVLPTTYERAEFKTETPNGATEITVHPPLVQTRPSAPPPIEFIDIGDEDPYLINHPKSDLEAPVSPSWESKRPLSRLTSSHEGSTGRMRLHYPSVWEGEITAVTISGDIRIGGGGVRTIKDSRKNWAYHEVVARKGLTGDHASAITVHEISGSVDFWVGESCLNAEWCQIKED